MSLDCAASITRSGRGFRETRDFEVRYWTVPELRTTFSRLIGPAKISVDGYFSLNAQVSDVGFMPPRYRAIVYASDWLRRLSAHMPPLRYVADSLYVTASRQDGVARRCAGRMMHLFINSLAASAGGGLTYIRNVIPHLAETPELRVTVALSPGLRQEFSESGNIEFLELEIPAAKRFWFEQSRMPGLIRRCGADVLLSTGNFALRNFPGPADSAVAQFRFTLPAISIAMC